MQRGFQKEAQNGSVSHFEKPPVRAVDSPANDPEPAAFELPGQLVVFRIKSLFIEAAELIKPGFVDQHEHSCRERFMETGQPLDEVIAGIQKIIIPAAVPAQNVRRDAMQRLSFDQIDRAPQKSGIRQFDIRVYEQNISTVRVAGAIITPD